VGESQRGRVEKKVWTKKKLKKSQQEKKMPKDGWGPGRRGRGGDLAAKGWCDTEKKRKGKDEV